MRILLVHNPKAGSEKHKGEELIEALEKAGHDPIYQQSKNKGIRAALKNRVDLVLVAGGDGTVAKVARRIIKSGGETPLRVLPLGVANNVARALGFCAPAKELISRLDQGKCETFDVGIARGPWGERYFFESAGAGLLASYLGAPKTEKANTESKAEEMRQHVTALRRLLHDYSARNWEIELDGEDFSGRYLLWEAMNIRSVGPVLTLAASAKTSDRAFDFVAAREEDRSVLLRYLGGRVEGRRPKFPLPARRFRKMRLHWKKWPLHFDDEVWPEAEKKRLPSGEIEIMVRASPLRIWRQRETRGKK